VFLGLHREIWGGFGAGNKRRGMMGMLLIMGSGVADGFMSTGESTRVLSGDGDGLVVKLETAKTSGVRRC